MAAAAAGVQGGAAAAAGPGGGAVVLGKRARDAIAGLIEPGDGQPLAEELRCAICTHPAFACPVTTPCEHLYHSSCLTDALRGKDGAARTCPVCRAQIPAGALKPPCLTIINMLNALEVLCPQGCGEPAAKRVRFDELQAHLNTCPETPRACAECGEAVPGRALQSHLAGECVQRQVQCPSCGTQTPFAAIPAHSRACPGDGLMQAVAQLRETVAAQQERIAELERQHRQATAAAAAAVPQPLQQQQQQQQAAAAAAPPPALTALQQQVSELRAGLDTMRKERDDCQGRLQRLEQQHGELAGKHAAQEQRTEEQRRMLLSYSAAAGLPVQVRLNSAEKPHLERVYTLMPDPYNGAPVWGGGDNRIFRNANGSWMVCPQPADVETEVGELLYRAIHDKPTPLANDDWLRSPGWVAAPGTSVAAVRQ